MAAGISAILGHDFPVFFGFRGVEGMATCIGILSAVATMPVLILGPLTIGFLALKRNTDVALAVMFVPIAPLCLLFRYPGQIAVYSILLPCIVAATHFGRMYCKRMRPA